MVELKEFFWISVFASFAKFKSFSRILYGITNLPTIFLPHPWAWSTFNLSVVLLSFMLGNSWRTLETWLICLHEIYIWWTQLQVCHKDWNPNPSLAIDETLYPYWGHISFKQYNLSKPAKYKLLYSSLCDASVSYTYYRLPDTGKPEKIDGKTNKYHVTGTDNYTKYLVNSKK